MATIVIHESSDGTARVVSPAGTGTGTTPKKRSHHAKRAPEVIDEVDDLVDDAEPCGVPVTSNIMVWETYDVHFQGGSYPYWTGHRKHGSLENAVGVVQVSRDQYIVATHARGGAFKAPLVKEHGDGEVSGDLLDMVDAAADGNVYSYSRLKDAKDRAASYAD
jgi:hypothetical protein